jgi:hypothetical protein
MPVTYRDLRRFWVRTASSASVGVILCCGWFATMELILRHPGYGWRFAIAAAIVVEGAVTIALFQERLPAAFRWPLAAAVLATEILGWWILAEILVLPGNPASPRFEGYLLIIGLALAVYGAATGAALVLTAAPSSALPASPARS